MPNYTNYLLRLEQLSLSEVLLSFVYYIPGLAIYKLHLTYMNLEKDYIDNTIRTHELYQTRKHTL